jgi:glycosyltransferase involved in cell wall biosynthesis
MNMTQFFYAGTIGENTGYGRAAAYFAGKFSSSGIRLICRSVAPGQPAELAKNAILVNIFPLKRLLSWTPLRWSLKAMTFLEHELFDRVASRQVENSSPVYAGQGQALRIFRRADKLGLKKILIAMTPQIELVWQIHRAEEKILGHDYEWLGRHLKNKILREYELADQIIVISEFSRNSFLEQGIPAGKLRLEKLDIDHSYFHRKTAKQDTIFRVLYVGRLTPEKGIHYLIKAFQELNLPGSELLLFGGMSTRGQNTWLTRQIKGWANIRIDSGDPRPAYEQSSLLAHPALQDAFAFTIPEALAYSLPVIVSANTGAKDLVIDGQNGCIIPIRDVEALKEKISFYYKQ